MTSGSALTHQQFAVCSIHYIIFGGSSKEGTNALRIDEDLKTCFCGPSDTFDNEPLLMEEPLQPFIVGKQDLTVCCIMRLFDYVIVVCFIYIYLFRRNRSVLWNMNFVATAAA